MCGGGHRDDWSGRQQVTWKSDPQKRPIACDASLEFLESLIQAKGLKWNTIPSAEEFQAVVHSASEWLSLKLCTDDEYSFLMLNVRIDGPKCINFVHDCLEFVKKQSQVDFISEGHLILLASLRMKQADALEEPYTVHLHGAESRQDSTEGRHRAPDFHIPDALLATWLHFAQALQIKTTCIAVPGFRPNFTQGRAPVPHNSAAFLKGLRSVIPVDAVITSVELWIDRGAYEAEQSSVMYT